MDRNDQILAVSFVVAISAVVLGAIATSAQSNNLAAWVQAIGVFAAVFLSGIVAASHAERQERARQARQLASTLAVINKALQAGEILQSRVLITGEGKIKRNPTQMLFIVMDSLTPLRIHELPDFELVSLAIDIKAGISGMFNDLHAIDLSTLTLQIPQNVQSKIDVLVRDCRAFIQQANSLKLR